MNNLTDNFKEADSPVNRNSFLWIFFCDYIVAYSLWILANQLILYSMQTWFLVIAYVLCIISFLLIFNTTKFILSVIRSNRNIVQNHFTFSFLNIIHRVQKKYPKFPFKQTTLIFCMSSVVIFHTTELVITPIRVSGKSMEPALLDNQWALLKKWPLEKILPPLAFPFKKPTFDILTHQPDLSRGQIIVFHLPYHSTSNNLYIKRVVALPKDHFEITDTFIIINGKKIKEPWLTSGSITEFSSRMISFQDKDSQYNQLGRFTTHAASFGSGRSGTVPPHTVLVLGDNRKVSLDSRHFGFVPKAYIYGILLK